LSGPKFIVIFDEQGLSQLRRDRSVKCGVTSAPRVKERLDKRLLRLVESHDTQSQRLEFRVKIVLLDAAHDRIRFSAVCPTSAAVIHTYDSLKTDCHLVGDRRRESNELRVVVRNVAESNETFMPTAVMPLKPLAIHAGAQALIQEAFKVLYLCVVGDAIV
jgi:hypothetical protein